MAALKKGLGPSADKFIVAAASYEVSDPTVDSQIVSLQASGADVLMVFATAKASAQAIRKTYDIGWRPLQIAATPGSTIAASLRPAGLEKSIGVISAFNTKDPSNPQWAEDPDVKEYRDFMRKYESSLQIRFLADFITTTSESRFWVHTLRLYAGSTKISANHSGISSITSWPHATS